MTRALTPADWTLDALCTQVDPDLFFPEVGASNSGAKRVCAACAVKAECLAFALATEPAGSRFGIWGGLSPRQRDRLPAEIRHRSAA